MKERRRLLLVEAAPGMTLADDICDAQGRVLVPAGAELSESLLQALARRDVESLLVEFEVAESALEREARYARVAEALAGRFRKAGDAAESRLLQQTLYDFLKDQR